MRLRLSYLEILFLISIAMSGVIMFYVGQLVKPVAQLGEEAVEQNALTLKILENNRLAGEDRQETLSLIRHMIEQDVNLTAENRVGLVTAINDTYYITIPAINNALQNLSERQVALITLAVDENEDTEELKQAHNITKDFLGDEIKIDVNKTHITTNNATTFILPKPIE